MAEQLQVDHGSEDGGRIGKRERARSTQGFQGRLLVAVVVPGTHRTIAGVDICGQKRRSTPAESLRAIGGQGRGLGDAKSHQ
jgi:hypothetical protein